MNETISLINSINNVKDMMNNTFQLLKDLDTSLSKHEFQPIYGNALATETSKSIYPSTRYSTFFPQYIARPYALHTDLEANKVRKILFSNVQFFHVDYEEIPPTLINSVIILPEEVSNIRSVIESWWLKEIVYETVKWGNVLKNGEMNECKEAGYKTFFWCRELVDLNSVKDIQTEVERLVDIFNKEN